MVSTKRARRLSKKTGPTVGRRIQATAGAVKAKFLPEGVALVVHKPGYREHELAVAAVYEAHGVLPLWSREARFSKRKVTNNYMQVFRKTRERPEVTQEIMAAFTPKKFFERNIKVELVYVPPETVSKLRAKDARDAIKRIAGATKPEKALADQIETGVMTIRGEALRQALEGGKPKKPDLTNNVVHVPDPQGRVTEMGWPTGFNPDLQVFVTAAGIYQARRKLARIKG